MSKHQTFLDANASQEIRCFQLKEVETHIKLSQQILITIYLATNIPLVLFISECIFR